MAKILILVNTFRSRPSDVFLGKCVPKICGKFTGKHPRRSVISIKLQLCNFIEIALLHVCSVTLLYIFRTRFCKNNSGGLYLHFQLVFPWFLLLSTSLKLRDTFFKSVLFFALCLWNIFIHFLALLFRNCKKFSKVTQMIILYQQNWQT